MHFDLLIGIQAPVGKISVNLLSFALPTDLYLLSILEPVWPSCSFFLNDLHPWRSPGSFPLQKLLDSSRAWHGTKYYKMEIMTTRLRFKPGTPESLDRCSNNWANWHQYWGQSDHHKMMDQTGILIPTSCS